MELPVAVGTVDGRWLARSSTVNFKYELTSHQQSLGGRFVRAKYLLETNDLQPITVVSYRLLHINLHLLPCITI